MATYPTTSSAKAAHVNMMTDTIIAHLPIDGLRSILRGLLGVDSKNTPEFHRLAALHLDNTRPSSTPPLFISTPNSTTQNPEFYNFQKRYRCLMGCGEGFQTLDALGEVILQTLDNSVSSGREYSNSLVVIDTDIVQAVTAVQKQLVTSDGLRPMTKAETETVMKLEKALLDSKIQAEYVGRDFAFQRGLSRIQGLSGTRHDISKSSALPSRSFMAKPSDLETARLGNYTVPRMLMGLWQFSSPAWGSASRSKINADFRKHVDAGFVAFDMADHYGDAETTFGQFRSSQPDSDSIFCATKWCVFDTVAISPEFVQASIMERLLNINADRVELLQFHWQDYNDDQYIEAAKLIEQDPRVDSLGLCNFDTQHMEEILDAGIDVVSNQVQFSLIDLRPTFKMAESCRKHNIKLLTYGSLCGGLLADKWLDKPAPNLFDKDMTPSHRKYLEMITVWGGWALFQELLTTLSAIGKKYDVSISSVAIRWVLEHDYVGAVIIGARMGISEHTVENLKVFGFGLDEDDQGMIQSVLGRCRAREVMNAMGDCGAEYRT